VFVVCRGVWGGGERGCACGTVQYVHERGGKGRGVQLPCGFEKEVQIGFLVPAAAAAVE
jgi:hypothetical protein